MTFALSSCTIFGKQYPSCSRTTRSSHSRYVSSTWKQSLEDVFTTPFCCQVRDNIALGDPATAHDDDRVRLAACLAGAEDFVEKLPEGFNTYLESPVSTEYSSTPEGQTLFTGRKVEYDTLRKAAGVKSAETSALSGGQMQRLAVARTYMRSVVQEDSQVGLLLFDEPSAALDPAAEHGTCIPPSSVSFVAKYIMQIFSTASGSCEAARRWYSQRTALAT